jgi:hypothetical protein
VAQVVVRQLVAEHERDLLVEHVRLSRELS